MGKDREHRAAAYRDDRELVLQGMYRRVVLGRAGAIDTPEDPYHPGGGFDLTHALRERARPARTTDRVCMGFAAGRTGAVHMEDLRITVQHRHDVITVPRVRNADNPRLDGNVEPDDGVQRIGVGRGTAVVVDRGTGPHFDQLLHRGVPGLRRGHVALL